MKREQGFSLIELMVVVVIIAILAGVALPSYREYVLRTNRTVAKAELNTLAARQEQYFVNNKSYADTLAKLGYSAPDDLSGIYTISVASANSLSFVVTADASTAQEKDNCGDLTLNQSGVKTKAGSKSLDDCW